MHTLKQSSLNLNYCFILLFRLQAILVLAIIYSRLIDAGASSTPKNLANLHHASSENLNLSVAAVANAAAASSNQFQNEYQYRQSATKPVSTSAERHKSSSSSSTSSPDATLPSPPSEHPSSNDPSNTSALDYSYMDNRAMMNVPDCKGRLKLNGTRGFITDGLGHYQTNLQCTWLIDSGLDNAIIRIQLHQFNTECNYDFLYVFDGDSIYSPLVAALSGDMNDFSGSLAEASLDDLISNNTDTTSQANQNNSTTASLETDLMHPATTTSAITPTAHPIELKTYSGKAFIYFHSDTAQSMPGFFMTYSVNSCPLECSNRGDCDYRTLTCKCKNSYGDGCQIAGPIHGNCNDTKSNSADCSLKTRQGSWQRLTDVDNKSMHPRAFHQSVIVDNTMWVIGGKTQALSNTNMGIYRKIPNQPTILAFDLEKRRWNGDVLNGTTGQDHLAELSGHSVAAHGNKVFVYGGMAMNNSILRTLSVFDTKTHSLIEILSDKSTKGPEEEFSAPLSVTGHSANIIDGYMYIFMGYNSLYGYLNFVQKFSIANNSWSIVDRKGSSVSGCIGHTSTFDTSSKLVFIYGGVHNSLQSNKLYSFNPHTEMWTYLQAGPSPRYYHSAVIMNGLLIILGGNSYNTSHQSDQCFQMAHLVYDLGCSRPLTERNKTSAGCGLIKCWSSPSDTSPGILKRHGHSLVGYDNRELLLFGGFNGVFMNDLRSLHIPTCSNFTSELQCTKPKLGIACQWSSDSGCELRDRTFSPQTSESDAECSKSDLRTLQSSCEARETCSDCLNTNLGCVWCGPFGQCQWHSTCKSLSGRAIFKADECFKDLSMETMVINSTTSELFKNGPPTTTFSEPDNEIDCKLDNCYLCQSKPHCSWHNDGCTYTPHNTIPPQLSPSSMMPQEELTDSPVISSQNSSSTRMMQRFDPFNRSFLAALTSSLLNPSCDVPCFMRTNCNQCTTSRCIWMSFTEQCTDSSAYFAYNSLIGHYVAHALKCPDAYCSQIDTCDKCLTNPKCGWLNDITSKNAGKGKCMEGNSSGPSLSPSSANYDLADFNLTTASLQGATMLPNWFYTSCPSCQCNGHSYCKANSSLCVQPCQDSTEGANCEKCKSGYFGDPINGGVCRPCRCNGHATSCNRESGKCYCSTKGIIGHNCNRCDDKNYYIGDPSSPGNGTCYYNLTTDYQYTFNMSKPEDHFYRDINFINVPLRKDSDIDFSIACSRLALVNITSGKKLIHSGLECNSFRLPLRFPHDRHSFSDANYSFFVHVYGFQTPFILQIAFSQHRTLLLPHFLFTFSSCFLFFFALSGLAWKLKHEYDLYIRRQRQFIEMEQMASRPFATILLEMFKGSSTQDTTDATQRQKPQQQQQQHQRQQQQIEPTPISFEPCFGSNVGVLSVFVQLPGKPNLAIGSALVSLNDEVVATNVSSGSHDDDNATSKRPSSKDS